MLIKVPVNVGNLSQINWKTQIPRKQNPIFKFQTCLHQTVYIPAGQSKEEDW
jgi:hypothetical protein